MFESLYHQKTTHKKQLFFNGLLTEFMDMSTGKVHGIKSARELRLPRGSCVVFDQGFTDDRWYRDFTESGVHFVTLLKNNAAVCDGAKCRGRKSPGVLEDRIIELAGVAGKFRKVRFVDEAGSEEYEFLTKANELPAATVSALYREGWSVELLFKWLKQPLRVKSVADTSVKAVRTQFWIALCAYLLLSFLKFRSRLGQSILQIMRLVQLNLFERRDLNESFCREKQKIPLGNNQL